MGVVDGGRTRESPWRENRKKQMHSSVTCPVQVITKLLLRLRDMNTF